MTAPVSAPKEKTKVLLVDDDPLARASLRLVLLRLDLEVLEASRPEEALNLLDQCLDAPVAVAVLDLKLAGASGLDVLRDVKQRSPQTEAVMVTGYETVEAAKKALRLGACDFINKPFEVPSLTAAIKRALNLHAASTIAMRREKELREMLEDVGPAAVDFIRIQRGIVHDIRNMLCMVRSYHYHVDQLLARHQQLGPTETSSMKSHIGVIGRHLSSAVDLLNRQAAVWRTESGQKEACNVARVLQDLVLIVQRHPDARLCDFALTTESEDMPIGLATSDVVDVLMNVLLNAAQSVPGRVAVKINARADRGPLIDLESLRGYTSIRHFGRKDYPPGLPVVRITVADDGAGIPPEVLVRLVKEQVTTKGSKGSGMGVGNVAESMIRHQGSFTIRSTPSIGTEAEVIWPAEQRAA